MPLYRRLPKKGFKNPFKTKIQNINFTMINHLIKNMILTHQKSKKKSFLVKKFLKNQKAV